VLVTKGDVPVTEGDVSVTEAVAGPGTKAPAGIASWSTSKNG